MSTIISHEEFERLLFAINHEESDFVKHALEKLHPEDVSAILYDIDTEGCIYVFNLIDEQLCADILVNLENDTRREFLHNFSAEQIAEWFNAMDSDDAADLLQTLPHAWHEDILQHIDHEHAQHIGDLLTYAEGTAGAIMEKELIKAREDWQIRQAIDEIRLQAENVEKIYSLYVVDNQNKLLGRVSLKKIILASDQTLIRDIYIEEDLVTVKTTDTAKYVAEVMQKYDLEALPVINSRGELVGRITIDDVVDLITDQAELERQLMSGLSEEVEAGDSIWHITRARLPWLIIGMFGGLVGAQFIGLFEADLALLPAMAFFIPLITATGGNVGIQSSSIVLQSLANKNAVGHYESFSTRLMKVMVVAILNGFVIGAIVFVFSYFIEGNIKLSLVVAIALLSVVILASLMGTITPIILDRFKINPAVASGPFITTANDLLGLAVYFTTARWLY